MELIGRLTKKFDTQKVSDKFKKREFILTTEESTPYPQPLMLEFKQDRCEILDKFDEGDEVKVQFNITGKKWEGPQGVKWFNTLDSWRMELVKKDSGTVSIDSNPARSKTEVPDLTQPETDNDLPY